MNIDEKFKKLGVDNAPGQEAQQKNVEIDIRGEKLEGIPVDFSHGDIDAHEPIPGSLDTFIDGFKEGGSQAYTVYRGKETIREYLAEKLSEFTGAKINGNHMILTPGTQGALFLAMGANVARGDKVAIVEPDYFANRKLVEFFEGELFPINMNYMNHDDSTGLDLSELERAFQAGVKLFLFSNPNNPTGVIYNEDEIIKIAKLAKKYEATLIVDELYSRQIFDDHPYTHLCAQKEIPENLITITGPSKTESLSGYRLGIAFGSPDIIDRMEKLQAIISLRCSGYNQAVFKNWFSEPEGWMEDRVAQHQAIRDDLLKILHEVPGVEARSPEGGSYLFIKIPEIDVSLEEFIRILRKQASVIVTPGTEFGPQFTDCFRINFSQDHKAAVDAIKRTITIMERYRK